jgi:hypothetical protein
VPTPRRWTTVRVVAARALTCTSRWTCSSRSST